MTLSHSQHITRSTGLYATRDCSTIVLYSIYAAYYILVSTVRVGHLS